MIRRAFWLSSGLVVGAGATVWAQRRVQSVARRLQPRQLAAGTAEGAGRSARRAAGHLRSAVDAGRHQARRREDELRRQLGGR